MALYDPTAAAALVAPQGMRWRSAHMVVELEGRHTRGMTVLEWRVPRRAHANVEVAAEPDEALLRGVVLRALAQAART